MPAFPSRFRPSLALVAAAGLACVAPSAVTQKSAVAQNGSEVLVRTGDAAPDGDGVFASVDAGVALDGGVVINDRGQIGFYAELTETAGFFDESAVIRVNRDGSLVQIARDDRGAPGGAGRYLSLGDVAINDAGQVAFEGFVTGGRPVGGAFGLFRGDEAGVSTIARSEQPAPPGTDTEYQFITGLDPVAMDPAGRVVYQAQVARRLPDGSTEPIANDDFIFVGSGSADPSRGGAPTVIAREGQAPPEGGGAFGSTLFSAVQINDAGQTLFHGQVVRQTGNPDFPQDFSDGIYRADAAGNLTTIARSGELDGVEMGTPVPGSAEPFSFFRAPAFNDRGEAAFQAAVRFEGTGIFRGDGTVGADGRPELTAIAVADQAVGGGTIFSVSQGVALNNAGEATFAASLFGTPNFPNDATAILRGDGTALDIVARSGWAAPTTAGGGVLAAAAAGSAGSDGTFQNFPFASLGDLVINDAGLVAFSGQMRDTSLGEANDNGLFLGDATELRAVIREGDLLSGGVVTDIRFDFDGGLNELGQVAYSATLADGTSLLARYTPVLNYRGGADGDLADADDFSFGLDPLAVQDGAAVYDLVLAPGADATIAGPAGDAAVKSLTLGGGAGDVRLSLDDAALRIDEGLAVEAGGTLAVAADAAAAVLGDLTAAAGSAFALELGAAGPLLDVAGDLLLGPDVRLLVSADFGPLGPAAEYVLAAVGGVRTGFFADAAGNLLLEGAGLGTFGGEDYFLTYAGGNGNDVAAISGPAAVPEPATLALLGLAAAGGVWRVRRRRA